MKSERARRNTIARVSAATAAILALASAAVAGPITMPLSDFVIFSGGGTTIGGHTSITGNVGSNQNVDITGGPVPGYPAQLNGSAYAGGNLTIGQDYLVFSSVPGVVRDVLSNGTTHIGGDTVVYGNIYGYNVEGGQDAAIRKVGALGGNVEYTNNKSLAGGADPFVFEGLLIHASGATETTFNPINLLSASNVPAPTVFVGGGANQSCSVAACTQLTLAANTHYGALSMGATKDLYLTSGDYYFDSMTITGGLDLYIDLTSGNRINIYVVGDISIGQNAKLWVKGAGTGVAYVLLSDAPLLASLIYWETHGGFTIGGSNQGDGQGNQIPVTWGGTLFASANSTNSDIVVNQYMNWTGAAYAFDDFSAADHGTWNYVPLSTTTVTSSVPEPVSLVLMGSGLMIIVAYGRRRRR